MVKVVVSIADSSLGRVDAVVAGLKAAGMVVDDVMEALGMVTGGVAESAMGRLKAVPGVDEVERQRAVGL